MVKPKHPYRFKTEDEFIKEYGEDWRRSNPVFFNDSMDYLLGTEFKHVLSERFLNGRKHINVPCEETNYPDRDYWEIHIAYLIENKSKVPVYMLSKKERERRFIYE